MQVINVVSILISFYGNPRLFSLSGQLVLTIFWSLMPIIDLYNHLLLFSIIPQPPLYFSAAGINLNHLISVNIRFSKKFLALQFLEMRLVVFEKREK